MSVNTVSALPYLYHGAGNGIAVYDVETDTNLTNKFISGFTNSIQYITVNSQSSYLYAVDGSKLYEVSLNNFTIGRSASGVVSPIGIWVNPEGSKLFIPTSSGQIQIFSTATMEIIDSINLPSTLYSNYDNLISTLDGDYLYVPSSTNVIYIIDTVSNSLHGYINLPVGSGTFFLGLRPDGSEFAARSQNNNMLYIVSTVNNSVSRSNNIATSMMSRVVYSPSGEYIYSYPSGANSPLYLYRYYSNNLTYYNGTVMYSGSAYAYEMSVFSFNGNKRLVVGLVNLYQWRVMDIDTNTFYTTYSGTGGRGLCVGGYPSLQANFVMDKNFGNPPFVVHFQDISSGYPVSWFWDFGDGITSTYANPSHTYTLSSNYTVSLTVTNANNETSTQYQTIWSGYSSPPPDQDWNISIGDIVIDFTGLISAIENFFSPLWTHLEELKTSANNLVSGLGNTTSSIISGIGNSTSSVLSGLDNTTSGIISGIGNSTSSVLSGLGNTTSGIVSGIGNSTSSVLSGLGNTTSGIISVLNNTTTSIGDWFSGSTNSIISSIGNATDRVTSPISGIYDFLTNTSDFSTTEAENSSLYIPVKDGFSSLNSTITGYFDNFASPVINISTSLNSSSSYLDPNNDTVARSTAIMNNISAPSRSMPIELEILGNIFIWLMVIGFVIRPKN